MKKLFLSLILLGATLPVLAQHHHHGHWRHGGDNRWYWMAPLIIGGAVVYEATRPPVIVQQPPVVVQTPPVQTPAQNCSPWAEVQNPDGTITRTRTCAQ
jgi:hypothetical protein